MSENEYSTEVVSEALRDLLRAFWPRLNGHGRVDAYKDLARRLNSVVGHPDKWQWRYVKSVMSGSVEPGKKFTRAVLVLAAQLDNPSIMDVEEVVIYARPGAVRPNALILASSRPCARPGCPVWFVPVVGNQQYHSPECRKKHHSEKGLPQ